MTKYEELINESDECCLKAIEFFRKGDCIMATFFKKVSMVCKENALNLTLEQAMMEAENV